MEVMNNTDTIHLKCCKLCRVFLFLYIFGVLRFVFILVKWMQHCIYAAS